MEQHTTTSRAEAERLLGVAEKLLGTKDLSSCKDFAILAQETEPLLEGSDQILAVAEVLTAAEKRVNNNPDWYSILQIGQRTDDIELIKKQYRRLALLLHPDKNKYVFADSAFRLITDAWAVLSDSGKKSVYDNEFSLFQKVDLMAMKRQKDLQQQRQETTAQQTPIPPSQQQQEANDSSQQKLPIRRSARAGTTDNNNNANNPDADGSSNSGPVRKANLGSNVGSGNRGLSSNFWTVCPYCYNLYEYPRIYEGCCLKCQNCERAFTGMEVYSKPPTIPGTETYHCCWGFFPMGFSNGNLDGEKTAAGSVGGEGFQNWMPPMFPATNLGQEQTNAGRPVEGATHGAAAGTGIGAGATAGGGSGFAPGGAGSGGGGVNSGVGGFVGRSITGGAIGSQVNAAKKTKVPKEGAKKRGRPRKNPW